MYSFEDWLILRENIENEIISIAKFDPTANVNKIAKIIRDKGYNVGSAFVSHVIKNWKINGEPTSVKPYLQSTDKELINVVIKAFRRNPTMDYQQISDLLKNQGYPVEPFQVGAILHRSGMITQQIEPKPATNYGKYNELPSPFFGNSAGGGRRITRTGRGL